MAIRATAANAETILPSYLTALVTRSAESAVSFAGKRVENWYLSVLLRSIWPTMLGLISHVGGKGRSLVSGVPKTLLTAALEWAVVLLEMLSELSLERRLHLDLGPSSEEWALPNWETFSPTGPLKKSWDSKGRGLRECLPFPGP